MEMIAIGIFHRLGDVTSLDPVRHRQKWDFEI
jgi:hypothetical protein